MKLGRLDKKLKKHYEEDKFTSEEKSLDKFHGMTDEEIAVFAADGDSSATEYLLIKYKSFARGKARQYFLVGADKEDIVQECMIGLYKAMRDFKKDKNVSFRAFADVCITRQVITAIKAATMGIL